MKVYLDESLRRFETVYPAAGDAHSAVKLTIPELEKVAGAVGWVDVLSLIHIYNAGVGYMKLNKKQLVPFKKAENREAGERPARSLSLIHI